MLCENVSTPFHDYERNVHIDIIQLNSRIENRDLVGEKLKISGWGDTVGHPVPGWENDGLHLKYTMIPVIGLGEWTSEIFPQYQEYGLPGSIFELSDNRTLNLTKGAKPGDSGGNNLFLITLISVAKVVERKST